ncbi:protein-(glutamine-N5) methyltransferase, release factor-specific [Reichenbachiella sp. 5M10]|uniref:peptide chain release factor N(5)-glutamine methyltransferase n=1 Tax=Reichenbachiella sp. 5M10 TaxID=1889772 RepID=UPI000C14FFAA|nr:peptide chain release factor N(5)-glutamine methyltransferase [Reichenbachiella sp. 5M10]PIB36334.1 protein-(glutamine-N5) methyltransferase, release factor-specific [Reichenbachiella sp. 5M10]
MKVIFPKETQQSILAILSLSYDIAEASSLSFLLVEHVFGWTRTSIIINSAHTPTLAQQNLLDSCLVRLQNQEPIQYIIGMADFYGRTFHVNEYTLIPRQETESLIQYIKAYQAWSQPKIADIGTGSGCIPCTLSLEMATSEVHAYDISEEALSVATQNAQALGCSSIQFHSIDILHDSLAESGFDLIVSNPPYVLQSEKNTMHANVLEHEPHLALFVEDDNPLVFYKVIARQAKTALKPGGVLFFEINEQYGNPTEGLLLSLGYHHTQIHLDIHGKDRFVSAQWG